MVTRERRKRKADTPDVLGKDGVSEEKAGLGSRVLDLIGKVASVLTGIQRSELAQDVETPLRHQRRSAKQIRKKKAAASCQSNEPTKKARHESNPSAPDSVPCDSFT